MNWERRGDFSRLVSELRDLHDWHHEFKWNRVSPHTVEFLKDIIERFFSTAWLSFHCVVVQRAMVRKELHGGDYDLARRKHFTKLLTNKIARVLGRHQGPQTFRIWVDPIASRYSKADEALDVIANNALKKATGSRKPIDQVVTRDSKQTPSIQLCDLLLGATMDAWQRAASSDAKRSISKWIAMHLGWSDLASDTSPTARKFNVWYFHDKSQGPRAVTTRKLALKYPLPP